jgi:CRP/FNR family transcriptional regulator, cyclic AMP receptor protein
MMISPETLRRFAVFAGLDPEVFKELAMLGEEVTLNAGDWLFKDGDAADALYLVLSGAVDLKIALDEAKTKYIDLETVVQGEAMGWSALVEPYEYTLGAAAAADVQLAKLDSVQLRKYLAENPAAGYTFMCRAAQGIAGRLTNMRVRLASMGDD